MLARMSWFSSELIFCLLLRASGEVAETILGMEADSTNDRPLALSTFIRSGWRLMAARDIPCTFSFDACWLIARLPRAALALLESADDSLVLVR